jgi:pectate lyase
MLILAFGWQGANAAEGEPSRKPAAGAVPAFPGAEGFGASATGGRGGKVLFVDSLEDNARNPVANTFRWACESQSGPRIVIFRIGGIIELARTVNIVNGDLTIAAQTAPGSGICLKGSGLSIEASNVIVRGLRSRAGDGKVGTSGQYRRSIQIIGPVSKVILDHCSASWGVDDCMNTYANKEGEAARDFTIQWCFLTEGLHASIHQQGAHSVAMTMGGGNIGPFSMHHNLLAHNNGRNPRIVWGATGEFVNNVIYNWGQQATVLEPFNPVKVKKDKRRPAETRPMTLNIIGNSWVPGPSTVKPAEIHFSHETDGTAIYLRGNVGPNRPQETPDGQNEAAIMSQAKRVVTATPAIPLSGLRMQPAEEATKAVLASAGAILPRRDVVDERVAGEVLKKEGRIIDSPAQVGGYPNYPPGAAPKDSDEDGMPDAWETANRLDKTQPNANGRDLDPDYDNIEVYINGLFSGAPAAGR